MKIKLLYKREFKFTGQDGQEVHGFTYGGKVVEGGRGITFTSQNNYEKNTEVDVELISVWDERTSREKFREKSI